MDNKRQLEPVSADEHRPSDDVSVDRRQYLAVLGVGVAASTAGCIETISGLADDLGIRRDAGGTVDGRPETFEFDAAEGADIAISISVQDEGTGTGDMTLTDPNGNVVDDRSVSLTNPTRTYPTAETAGTYSLRVSPGNARLSVSVNVDDPDE